MNHAATPLTAVLLHLMSTLGCSSSPSVYRQCSAGCAPDEYCQLVRLGDQSGRICTRACSTRDDCPAGPGYGGACLPEGYCLASCEADSDCTVGSACVPTVSSPTGEYFPANLCAPTSGGGPTEPAPDTDPGPDDPGRTGLLPYCRAIAGTSCPAGEGCVGAHCEDDSECTSENECVLGANECRRRVTERCDSDVECASGTCEDPSEPNQRCRCL